jgi:serine protease inhibitor
MTKGLLAALAIIGLGCQSNDVSKDNEPNTRTLSAAETQVREGSNKFAFKLFKKIQKSEPENTFISPLSVSSALAMTLNGAEGETQQSILNTIDYGDFSAAEVNDAYKQLTSLLKTTDRKIELGLANSVWYTDNLHVQNTFANVVRDFYDGTVQGLDFNNGDASKQIINSWVEQKTHDRIKNLIEEIANDQVMFLVNAIYFKGDWTYKFDKSKTKSSNFATPSGNITTDLMFSEGSTVNFYSDDNLQLVDIPYGNEQFSFTLLMPHQAADVKSLIDKLNPEDLSYWLSQSREISARLELPKFKMEWKLDLKQKLAEMGMNMYGFPNLFEEDVPLAISSVVHQSFVEVNEEGSEAAAATVVSVVLTSAPAEPTTITIDKSFVFMIREKHTGIILFIGQLIDPSQL